MSGQDGPSGDWMAAARSLSDRLRMIASDRQLAFIREEVEKLPPDHRELVTHFVTAMVVAAGQGAIAVSDPAPDRTDKKVAVICGVGFMIAIMLLAVLFPSPTAFQYLVFRIVLAIAVAGFAATIPGFLEVRISGWVKAGGALAVFFLVFFYNPARLVIDQPPQGGGGVTGTPQP